MGTMTHSQERDGQEIATHGDREVQRLRKEKEESEERYRSLQENILNGYALHEIVYDEKGEPVDYVFLEVNARFEQVTGLESSEIVGRRVTEVIPGIEADRGDWISVYGRVTASQAECTFEEYCEPLGRWYHVLAYSSAENRFVTIFEDVTKRKLAEAELRRHRNRLEELVEERTRELKAEIAERERTEAERRRLEAQVQQSQKLESLGILAGGIAHDFNNILGSLLGNAELATIELRANSPVRPYLENIQQAGWRAAELVQQMLAYAGKGKVLLEEVDLTELVRGMMSLLEAATSKKTDLRFDLSSSLPAVKGDPAQLRQVVMNLVTNASDAVGENEGRVSVRTYTRLWDQTTPGPLAPRDLGGGNPYVVLEVFDDGCGMDHDTRTKIFDPFFTTKFTGRGLGLAAVQGIVRSHDGEIHVDSEPDGGSVFRIILPALGHPAPRKATKVKKDLRWRAIGTVLLVDDEGGLRAVAAKILERFGLTVLEASDGVEAVEAFKRAHKEISCVILDLNMPRMGGAEAFERIRELDPGIPVILSSGFGEEQSLEQFPGKGAPAFLKKPYDMVTLQTALQVVWDDGR